MIGELVSKMTLEEKVGQMCVPILQSDHITPEIREQIAELGVGIVRFCPTAEFDNASVLVGKPNRYMEPDEMAEFLNSLQKLAETAPHKIPLIISVDQEGGTRSDVNRNDAVVYASHMCFGAADDPELTYQVSRAAAEEFRSMGINMIQSPIVDVYRYEGRQTMKAATFGADPEKVAKHAIAMKRGFRDGGVISMMKHFPGYGSIATDAHKGTARIVKDLKTLEQEDILPFKKLIEDGIDGVMAGHVIVECLDRQYPATLSPTLLRGYLRGKLGFDGLIETDAMRMKAIQDNYGTGAATVLAVKAGCDAVLLRGSYQHFRDGYDALLAAARSGEISMEMLDGAVTRILRVKEQRGLFENCYADPAKAKATVGCAAHKALVKKLAYQSVSVFQKQDLPLCANDGKRIAVISPEPQKIGAAMDKTQSVDMLIRAVKNKHQNTEGLMTALTPDGAEIARAVALAQTADVIILGTVNAIIYDEQIKMYNALKALEKPLIVVAMESPCDASVLEDVRNYITTYGCANDWMIAAADCIFGDHAASGVPPIDMAPVLK